MGLYLIQRYERPHVSYKYLICFDPRTSMMTTLLGNSLLPQPSVRKSRRWRDYYYYSPNHYLIVPIEVGDYHAAPLGVLLVCRNTIALYIFPYLATSSFLPLVAYHQSIPPRIFPHCAGALSSEAVAFIVLRIFPIRPLLAYSQPISRYICPHSITSSCQHRLVCRRAIFFSVCSVC